MNGIRTRRVHLSRYLSRAPTFGALATAWLRAEAKRLVCPDNERRHLEHLKPLLRLTEEELTPRRVKSHLLSLLRENGGTLGPSTVNKVRSTGKRAIRDAQLNREWHSPNPFELAPRMREAQPAYRTLTLGQVRRTLKHLRRDRWRECVFNLLLGPRPGETWRLRREDVNARSRTVTIDDTKTRKKREVPVPAALWPVLVEAMRETSCEYVFPTPDGRQQNRYARLSRVLRTAMAAARIVRCYRYVCRRAHGCGEYVDERPKRQAGARCPHCTKRLYVHAVAPRMRWYDVRHCSATLHWASGCDALVVATTLGHSVRGTTGKTYVHLTLSYQRRELSKLATRLLR